MAFVEIIDQAIALLRDRVRISYRVLKREFTLDEEQLADLKDELIDAQRVARDEDGKVLVWVGAAPVASSKLQVSSPQPLAERRQLTVMFCDLVGSTALSTQLDPEDLRAVVRQYQQTCAEVIQRHDGYIAQYLGDGLLVYFGYPTAHEDDARRAVRTGLEIIQTLRDQVPSPLAGEGQGEGASGKERKLQVRIGIHTGLVVIGDIGTSGRTEQLALGETPNIAARIQGIAEPNTVIVSAATHRLVEGQFESQPFGSHLFKGLATPIAVYHVQSERQSGSHLAGKTTLTPLIGREQEMGLLIDRWEQAKEGRGQVVLLSGEPGIGKSRLALTLRAQVTVEGSLLFEARCSPYHQHSALYPLIEVMQRTLLFTRHDTDDEKVTKLERALAPYNMQDSLLLFTTLLSLPTPATAAPLMLTPQKQKERTLQALLQMMIAQAERQATVSVWEDLHWADPSSLEFLSLLIDQLPTSKLLLVLTFRPEFTPLWKPRSHISQLVLNRLSKKQVEAMIEQAAAGSNLSAEVIEQIRLKTDGVPLFVEELTKSVVEARGQVTGNGGREGKPVSALAIPATLQEALLARLDRLSTARQVAQLGATLGREFSYELLQAVALINELDLQTALTKLVEAEILYQRGIGEQARYFFKHALIQDTAYQSLLKSTRQQYHQQIAQVLEEQFLTTKATQPELLAHHYTEAGLIGQAIPYWQLAGEHAARRSASAEALNHVTKGLALLTTLPDTPERAQQELMLLIARIGPLIGMKGWGAPELESLYARARELSQQVGETPQLFPVLSALQAFYMYQGEFQTACDLGAQCLRVAQHAQDQELLLAAHGTLAWSLLFLGELPSARTHVEQCLALYDPQKHRPLAFRYGQDFGAAGLSCAAYILWDLGYPDQALARVTQARCLAEGLSHPYSLAMTLHHSAKIARFRREPHFAREYGEACIALSGEQGVPQFLALCTLEKSWALSEQRQGHNLILQMRQILADLQATGLRGMIPSHLALVAEVCGKEDRSEEGLSLLTEALDLVNETGEGWEKSELYRLKGELTLQSQVQGPKSKVEDAEKCFHRAIDVAHKQQAKSLELRAATSLARLWQSQGKKAEAHKLLSDVYNWFTEGFDTKDLLDAKVLLKELAEE